MVRNPIDIWFDFIDPASVLLMLEIEAATTSPGHPARRNRCLRNCSTVGERATDRGRGRGGARTSCARTVDPKSA
jgi:hypothetical protein